MIFILNPLYLTSDNVWTVTVCRKVFKMFIKMNDEKREVLSRRGNHCSAGMRLNYHILYFTSISNTFSSRNLSPQYERRSMNSIRSNKEAYPDTRKTVNFKRQRAVTVLLIAFDIISVNAAYFLSLLMRFDFRFSEIPANYLNTF